jgi:alpha-tubulin suppressor-like RCC1 family protein
MTTTRGTRFAISALIIGAIIAACASPPVLSPPLAGATQIAAGGATCAVLSDGTAKCWGNNFDHQLGSVAFGNSEVVPFPVTVTGISTTVQVAPSGGRTCALLRDGSIRCWGMGYLGNGTTSNSVTPVMVSGITDATRITNSCALVTGGSAKCWGHNGEGDLGNGSTVDSAVPVDVLGVAGATEIEGTCVLVAGGTIKCWGNNSWGQLGNGSIAAWSTAPVDVIGISGATQISSAYGHRCALLPGGTVKCWGFNRQGQLGDGSTDEGTPTPVDVVGLTGATQVTAGEVHTCALMLGGTVKCWGDNSFGQLGDRTTTGSTSPVDVQGITNATQVSGGGLHTCALLADSTVRCWGRNAQGELGIGNTLPSNTPGTVVAGF